MWKSKEKTAETQFFSLKALKKHMAGQFLIPYIKAFLGTDALKVQTENKSADWKSLRGGQGILHQVNGSAG